MQLIHICKWVSLMKNIYLIISVLASILSFILSIVQYSIQISISFISSIFFLYMGIISLSIAVYSIGILNEKSSYNKVIFWILIILFAFGVMISIFSVGIFYLPILIILILTGIFYDRR